MNWKSEAIKELKNYSQRKVATDNIKERIKTLEEQYVSLKGVSIGEPVMGGFSRQEEKMLDNITERENLKFNLLIVEKLNALTEKGLGELTERERLVLEGFYFFECNNHVETLCRKMNVEKSTLYRIKDEALRKFTLSMYGIAEI
jgi:DNA-directed RNA polymerase specialized sigma subunit